MAVKPGAVTLPWADGEYAFRLGIGEWQELFRKTGAGPEELYKRVAGGTWRIEDLRETIRNGLLGADMVTGTAAALIKRYVDERPAMENLPIVQAILLSGLMGPPDGDVPKKAKAAGGKSAASPSAASTKTERPSGSIPEPLTP